MSRETFAYLPRKIYKKFNSQAFAVCKGCIVLWNVYHVSSNFGKVGTQSNCVRDENMDQVMNSLSTRCKQIFLYTNIYIPRTLSSQRSSKGISETKNYLPMLNTADVTGGKPIAVWSQSISGVNAINPLVDFTTSMEESERCFSFILSRTPQETFI
jgi:hypothetical protein